MKRFSRPLGGVACAAASVALCACAPAGDGPGETVATIQVFTPLPASLTPTTPLTFHLELIAPGDAQLSARLHFLGAHRDDTLDLTPTDGPARSANLQVEAGDLGVDEQTFIGATPVAIFQDAEDEGDELDYLVATPAEEGLVDVRRSRPDEAPPSRT